MSKQKTESHYKVLSTTANIGQGRIREKYIDAVKKHPPESDPEMFEKIRAAYETLKDPSKRKQYDLFRKYGNKVEDMIEEAENSMAKGNYTKAITLFKKALSISPNNLPSYVGLMQIAIDEEDLKTARKYFQQALENHKDIEEQCTIYDIKAHLLADREYFDEALEVLDEGKNTYPDKAVLFDFPRIVIYMEMDEYEKAWDILIQSIQNQDLHATHSCELFMAGIRMLISTEMWERKPIIRAHFRKFIQKLDEVEVRQALLDRMMNEYEELIEVDNYLGAEIFIDFAKMLDGNDSDIRKRHQEVKKMAQVQKDLFRLENDDDAFPLLFIRAMELFYNESEELHHMLSNLPLDVIASLEDQKEDYAAGIIRLRKKYPSIYRHYKKQWDDLFAELTKEFNREMKRYLRKIK